MSAVIDGVTPAATPAAPEVKQPESFAELQKTWTPEQRQKWNETGEEPQPTAAKEPVEPETPAPEKAKPEPSAGAGEEDQDPEEPEYFGTPEQVKKQKHAFAKVKRERAEARAEAKILREQLAGKSAVTAAAPKAEPKSSTLEKPKRPTLPDATDFEDAAAYKAAVKKYDAEMEVYEEKRDTYRQAMADEESAKREAEKSVRERAETWKAGVGAIKEEHGDEAVASIMNLVVSLPMMGVLMGMKDGAKAYLYFAQNPELAAELTKETDIPGNYQNYEELTLAAQADPSLARQLSAAEAVVRHETRRILRGSTARKADPAPKPITVSRTPAPAERVNASGSVTKDPIAEAWAQYDKTGEHKYLALANRLEDERDGRERRGTR